MTHKPPVPNANTSPYPLAEAEQGARTERKAALAAEGGEAMQALKEQSEAKRRTRTALGVGAAVGIGSAAIAGALLYWNRKNDA